MPTPVRHADPPHVAAAKAWLRTYQELRRERSRWRRQQLEFEEAAANAADLDDKATAQRLRAQSRKCWREVARLDREIADLVERGKRERRAGAYSPQQGRA